MDSNDDSQTEPKSPFQECGEETEDMASETQTLGRSRRVMLEDYKIFNDPIHGNISIHPLCVKIIDTPQFQRLRQIKQLGAVQYVYPGATHTRFEHCIGVCYLAGKWVRKLIKSLPDEDKNLITEEDILCVMIGGLCHDLGHGPFSHMFEMYIESKRAAPSVNHEELSVKMFEHLLEKNNLRQTLAEDWGMQEEHIGLIKDIIRGNPPKHGNEYQLRKPKMFLYQIVNNERHGVDVDKWEYLARDCQQLNITNSFDYRRLMKFSRVLKDLDGSTLICFRDKEIENIYKMFEMRYDLHRQAYNHRVTHVIHLMIADALIKANGHLAIPGKDDDKKTVGDCVEDMVAFTNLTDNIVFSIMTSRDENLAASKEILSNLSKRRLYPTFRTKPIDNYPEKELRKKVNETTAAERIREIAQKGNITFNENEIVVHFVKMTYNKDENDPTLMIKYYSKQSPKEISSDRSNEALRLKPKGFQQYVIAVTCRDVYASKEKKEALAEAVKTWFDQERL